MKTYILLFVLCVLSIGSVCVAQTGNITTIAGDGVQGYSGDGGPATAAEIWAEGNAIDHLGNIYIADIGNNVIRKINNAGVISTIAGNGIAGYSGDGGSATAAKLNQPICLTVDVSGNVYFIDYSNFRIRKVDTSGIITTIAGNGIGGYSGDGGPATAAEINQAFSIVADISDNIYFADSYNNRIRKVTSSGIISTVAGNGSAGFSGDGGLATVANLWEPRGIDIDRYGNIFIADEDNFRIRKVTSVGIISTIAGNGSMGYSGDGGPATAAKLNAPSAVAIDNNGNVYVSDNGNARIRKIYTDGLINTIVGTGVPGYTGDGGPATAAEIGTNADIRVDALGSLFFVDDTEKRIRKVSSIPDIVSDSFSVHITKSCSGPEFQVLTSSYHAGFSVLTYFGDGQSNLTTVINAFGSGYADIIHSYNYSGTYTVKQVLLNGFARIDSISYSYEFLKCQSILFQVYHDMNADCVFTSGIDLYNYYPITVEVDSNGVAIDTLSMTSGLYYNAYGSPGDIYKFKILSTSGGFVASCSGGIILDTIQSVGTSQSEKNIGLTCSGLTGFDIAEYTTMIAGRHLASGTILVNNTYCNPQSGILTLNVSPKYVFYSAYPPPTSIVGNTVTWDLGTISSSLPMLPPVGFTLAVPGTWLLPGDTVNDLMIANPTVGDIDISNNIIIRNDTIKSSYDPNEMSVKPEGFILPGMKLQYSINFENTGNDTARNIYIMDTLSDNIDPHTLNIVAASGVMNITLFNDGAHNIVKCDFPGINLPDSSHHNQCDGMVIFKVSAKQGLSDSTTIFNHAGIFFDDNPVVMTDTVENVVGLIAGASGVCVGSSIVLTENVLGGIWSCSNSRATITGDTVTGMSSGIDTINYTVTNEFGTYVATKTITINPLPSAGYITGPNVVCEFASIGLSDTASFGIWSSSNSSAAVIGGGVTGISVGIDTIMYKVSNGCGTAMATHSVTVNISPSVVTGTANVCVGSITALSDTAIGGTWSSMNTAIATIGSITGIATGVLSDTTIIEYSLYDGCTAFILISVNPSPAAITGIPVVCAGSTTVLSDGTIGGSWNSGSGGIATVGLSSGVVAGVTTGTSNISYTLTSGCFTTVNITVNPLPTSGIVTGVDSICEGQTDTLQETIAGGVWSSNMHSSVSATGIVTGILDGIDTITYTVTNVCGVSNSMFLINILPATSCHQENVVVKNSEQSNIIVYPNPTNDELNITDIQLTTNYRLLSITGIAISQGIFLQGNNTISMQKWSSGIYILELNNANGEKNMYRIVKE